MQSMKKTVLRLLSDTWLGTLASMLGRPFRNRRTFLGLTNPVYLSHVATQWADRLYLSPNDGYLAGGGNRRHMVRFDADTYEPEITYLMQRLIGPEDVVLDIGANIGFHTVTMAEAAHKGHVFAFEPVPEMAERNSANCALNRLDNVTLVPCALGVEEAELDMLVNIGGEGLQGTSTFLADNFNVHGNPGCYEKRPMKVRRLDGLISELGIESRIGFMKIDTEGFDTQVIEGGLETIRKNNPVIIVEAHSKRLEQAGKSWQWYLDTFPDHHILICHALNRANPYLHLEPLTPDQPEISVNLLLLPKATVWQA